MRYPVLVTSLALLVAACVDDDPTRQDAAITIAAQPLPQDPYINPNDTYVLFDAEVVSNTTLTFDHPVQDPATGQQTTQIALNSPPDTLFHVDAGYDANGVVRITTTGRWSTTLDTLNTRVGDTYRLVLTNGQLQQFSASGAQLVRPTATEIGDTIPPVSQLLAGFGNDLLYGDITAGSVDSLAGAASSTASDAVEQVLPSGERLVRRYGRSGDRRVLQEITLSREHSGDRIHVASVQRVRFLNMYVHSNHAADSLRVRRRAAGDAIDVGSRSIDPGEGPLLQQCYEEQCFPNGGGGTNPPPPPPPPPPPGRNVAFQHGMGQTSAAWARMDNWLTPKYRFGAKLRTQTSSVAGAQQQADELRAALQSTGLSGFLVVGHSMGGLVARRAAQQTPGLITGVLTVGTPHQGAYAALQTRATITAGVQRVAGQMYFDLGCRSANQSVECFVAAVAYHFIPDRLGGLFEETLNSPAIQDLKAVQFASNPFITNLNAATESFTRVGIQSYPSKRWVEFRLVGDASYNPEAIWGGRFYVTLVSDLNGALRFCQVISALVARWNTFRYCTLGYNGLQQIDGVWDAFTAPHDSRTDGVVQGTSQVYPGSAVNYIIPGGDSHLGEPKSDRTRPIIERAFDVNFQVPRN